MKISCPAPAECGYHGVYFDWHYYCFEWVIMNVFGTGGHRRLAAALVWLLGFAPLVCWGEDGGAKENPLQLTLPSEFFAVPGAEMSIYFDNVVLTVSPQTYRFDVSCDIGSVEDRRWTVTPAAKDVGTHSLSIKVSDREGNPLGIAKTQLRVVPEDAGAGRSIRLLIVGDSLTNATAYPNEIARLLSRPGNPTWQMLGTHKPSSASRGVVHEGYSGWTWNSFVSRYEPRGDGSGRKRSSPFVYLSAAGKPGLDVGRYLREECGSVPPDFVIFMLGINDCFHAPPDDGAAIDARIDGMFAKADELLRAFRSAAAEAEIGICVTTPPNSREEAFFANYKGAYHRWGWKRIQHQLVQRQLAKFEGQQGDNLFVVPTQLNLDPVDGYPPGNGVHPNKSGYGQIGGSIYAWLKSRLAKPVADNP